MRGDNDHFVNEWIGMSGIHVFPTYTKFTVSVIGNYGRYLMMINEVPWWSVMDIWAYQYI